MRTRYFELVARDPIISRDSRPFGLNQGRRMRPLPWVLPSVVAGSLRTALVKASPNLQFDNSVLTLLAGISVAGFFPVHENKLYLPAPKNAIAQPGNPGEGIARLHRILPQEIVDGGCDFPVSGLKPVMLTSEQVSDDFKPADVPDWWPLDRYTDWLIGKDISFDTSFLCRPVIEVRDHVKLDPLRGAAMEHYLFTSAALNLTHLPRFGASPLGSWEQRFAKIELSIRVRIDNTELEDKPINTWHPLGGERRIMYWQEANHASLWECSAKLRQVLEASARVCLVLATPAIFSGGWKPGWLNDQLEGQPPGLSDTVKLRLVGVCNERWRAVSGWSLAKIDDTGNLAAHGKRGPKPIRRTVPAGSVYFFEVKEGNASTLANLWLQPISDDPRECRDGFGLALWGVW